MCLSFDIHSPNLDRQVNNGTKKPDAAQLGVMDARPCLHLGNKLTLENLITFHS
jgi:hypothetical protein